MKIYVIKSKDGKYFRAKGYNSYNSDSWVDDLDRARIYTKIGPAKSQVTFWYNNYPEYGCPDILEFELVNPTILDMEKLTKKAINKIKQRNVQAEIRANQLKIDSLNAQIKNAKSELNKINKKG